MKLTRLKSDRPRRKHDFYPTPYGLAKAALNDVIWHSQAVCGDDDILDAGAGKGVWGQALFDLLRSWDTVEQDSLTGIDIEYSDKPSCYHAWYKEDYLDFVPPHDYDLIMGNPPYSLMEEFVRKSFGILNSSGYIFFLGRLEFLASKKRAFGLFADHPLHSVYVLSRRPSFFSTNGRKTTDAQDYAMYLWQKDSQQTETKLRWLYWEYDDKYD